jgi:hypothetical protein
MKKRQKAERLPIALFSSPIPPSAPPGFVPPTVPALLDRLAVLSESSPPLPPAAALAPAGPPPAPPDAAFLDRLRALASADILPIPASPARIEPRAPPAAPPAAPAGAMAALMHYDAPLGFGIGRALQYIAAHGVLVPHRGDAEPLLEYRDDAGRRVAGKAAFKHQSHIFGGRRPGERQQRKALARQSAEARREAADVGDTPLHTASALRRALAQRQTAFLELSGAQRTVVPYEPAADGGARSGGRRRRPKMKRRARGEEE